MRSGGRPAGYDARMNRRATALTLAALLATRALATGQEPQIGMLQQLLEDPAASFWVYDDLERGEVMARDSGKPLLVSFRCVP